MIPGGSSALLNIIGVPEVLANVKVSKLNLARKEKGILSVSRCISWSHKLKSAVFFHRSVWIRYR